MPPLRINKIRLENFKAFEEFELEFPPPRMEGDPDVTVIGSRNGIGKTSILEACALVYYVLPMDKRERSLMFDRENRIGELFLRANERVASVDSEIQGQSSSGNFKVTFTSNEVNLSGSIEGRSKRDDLRRYRRREVEGDIVNLLGWEPNPLVTRDLLYLHSYRKISEGDGEFSEIMRGARKKYFDLREYPRRYDAILAVFKLQVLQLLFGKSGVFEDVDSAYSKGRLELLNDLVDRYANGTFEKLRAGNENRIQLRVTLNDGSGSIPFDSLSSGQKEIISTMFLIWNHTKDQPGLVLIDEPELHLNYEWQQTFIRTLHELAPWNQYIISTHSEAVFGSVDADRRVILENQPVQ